MPLGVTVLVLFESFLLSKYKENHKPLHVLSDYKLNITICFLCTVIGTNVMCS